MLHLHLDCARILWVSSDPLTAAAGTSRTTGRSARSQIISRNSEYCLSHYASQRPLSEFASSRRIYLGQRGPAYAASNARWSCCARGSAGRKSKTTWARTRSCFAEVELRAEPFFRCETTGPTTLKSSIEHTSTTSGKAEITY